MGGMNCKALTGVLSGIASEYIPFAIAAVRPSLPASRVADATAFRCAIPHLTSPELVGSRDVCQSQQWKMLFFWSSS